MADQQSDDWSGDTQGGATVAPIWSDGDASQAPDDALDMPTSDDGSAPASESGNALPGMEQVPEYVPLSNSETVSWQPFEEEAAVASLVDADWADDPEFFRAVMKKLPKLIKVIRQGAQTAGGVLSSPVGTAVMTAAGGAIGIPPPVTAAVSNFARRLAQRREAMGLTEAEGPSGPPSLLEVVIGADDRVKINNTAATPWSGICHLEITAKTGARFIGTGWLISPRCVITAGHCVHIRSAGGWASQVVVSPGRNGSTFPFGRVSSARFSALPRWVSHADRNFDCACIILPRPARSSTGTAPFNFRYAVKSDAGIRARALNLSGYPGDKGGITQWFHARGAQSVTPSVITYDVDTAGGQSGSPVWHLENNVRTAVGIHTNGSPLGNSATRITPTIKAYMDAWRASGL